MKKDYPAIAKITRPRLPEVFPRQRLFKLMDRGVRFPVTWITGPPGSGKTTLVASYIDNKKFPCIWYQIDDGDGDLATFFYYMGMAARKAAPRIKRPLPLLTPEYQFGIPTFTRRFFEDLFSRLKPPASLVLDNYQEASEGSAFHETVVNGLSMLPPGITVYIVSRAEPPPAFARMQANSGLSVVGWEQLRLTPEETSAVMRLRTGKPQSKDSARLRHEKTQGWASGVVLMEALQAAGGERNDPATMEPGKLSDYFAGEIFGKLSEDTRDFLLRTSFLPRFDPAMAEAITGNKRAAQILAELNHRNYFTERRSEPGAVYQYHALFREFLKSLADSRYSAAECSSLMLSAAKLLEEAGQIEDAAELYRVSSEWSGLIRIIIDRAPALSAQGRSAALEKGLAAVPAEMRERSPWLLYWMGVCRLPFVPADARTHFEKAYALFSEEQDPAGIFLSWSGIVESFIYEWNDFSALDQWISALERHLKRYSAFPSPDIEARVSLNFFAALFLRQPGHPRLPFWEQRVENLLETSVDNNIRLMSGHWLLLYNALSGDIPRADRIFDILRTPKESADPAERILAKTLQAYYFWAKGYREESLKAAKSGLETAKASGVHVWSFTIASIAAYSSLASGDRAAVEHYLENMTHFLDKGRAVDMAHYHYILGWQSLMKGDTPQAQEHARIFLRPDAGGVLFFTGFHHIAQAMILFALGNFREAFAHLKRAKEIGKETKSALIEFHAFLAEADFELARGRIWEGHALLKAAFVLGREKQIFNFDWWLPDIMARLCMTALEQGIEPSYVREFIKRHDLFPETPPLHIESWPWPLRIFTLGTFEVRKDDKPLVVSKKVQKKPLQLLKALIALGGMDVREDRLADLLWPDAEGDLGLKAVNVNTLRLRKLLGSSEAIMVRDGCITLNLRLCWVDVRAFEKAVESVEFGVRSEKIRGPKADGMGRKAEADVVMLEKVLALYRGPFLADEPGLWAVSLREKLRDRFLRTVDALGAQLERAGQHHEALRVYRRGLEVDDLAEPYYCRMMNCHISLGSQAEALSVYKRCRKTLASYGVEPSIETEALRKSLLKQP